MDLPQNYIDDIIITALKEDINYIDVTTDYLIDDESVSEAYYVAKDDGVLCGIDIAKRVSVEGIAVPDSHFETARFETLTLAPNSACESFFDFLSSLILSENCINILPFRLLFYHY